MLARGRVRVTPLPLPLARRHLEELTFTKRDDFGAKGAAAAVTICAGAYDEATATLEVPRAYGFAHFDVDVPCAETTPWHFEGALKDDHRSQPEAAAALMEALSDPKRRGGTLSLPCGYGKTCVALYICAQRGGRAIILVHKSCLLEQWEERIKTFLPSLSIGRLRGPKCDVEGKDVVLGMMQSIHSHPYPEAALTGYTTLVVDEAHHVPADTFLDAVGKCGAEATLALTATPERRDGLTGLLYAAMGNMAFAKEREWTAARVKISTLPCKPTIREKKCYGAGSQERVNMSRLITDLCQDPMRNDAIVRDIINIFDENPDPTNGRYVIVLSDRIAQLKDLQEKLLAANHPALTSCGYGGATLLIGATKAKDRQDALEARVVLSSYQFAAEGLDRPRFDTLILASPKGDVTQAVGRILRDHGDKNQPLILDYSESISSGVLFGLLAKRKKIYAAHGFDIHVE